MERFKRLKQAARGLDLITSQSIWESKPALEKEEEKEVKSFPFFRRNRRSRGCGKGRSKWSWVDTAARGRFKDCKGYKFQEVMITW